MVMVQRTLPVSVGAHHNPGPLLREVIEAVRDTPRQPGGGLTQWELLIQTIQHPTAYWEGGEQKTRVRYPEEAIEEAIQDAVDKGAITEPVLGQFVVYWPIAQPILDAPPEQPEEPPAEPAVPIVPAEPAPAPAPEPPKAPAEDWPSKGQVAPDVAEYIESLTPNLKFRSRIAKWAKKTGADTGTSGGRLTGLFSQDRVMGIMPTMGVPTFLRDKTHEFNTRLQAIPCPPAPVDPKSKSPPLETALFVGSKGHTAIDEPRFQKAVAILGAKNVELWGMGQDNTPIEVRAPDSGVSFLIAPIVTNHEEYAATIAAAAARFRGIAFLMKKGATPEQAERVWKKYLLAHGPTPEWKDGPADTPLREGDRVFCNGYPGTVLKVHTGQLAGMVDVRLPGGVGTVSVKEVSRIQENPLMYGYAPDTIYHGTDAMSALFIQKVGFREPDPYFRTTRAEPGFMYGTTEPQWAEHYAIRRALNVRTREGVILAVDVRGLAVETDPTVAMDSLLDQAFRVPLPVGPERVTVFKTIPVAPPPPPEDDDDAEENPAWEVYDDRANGPIGYPGAPCVFCGKPVFQECTCDSPGPGRTGTCVHGDPGEAVMQAGAELADAEFAHLACLRPPHHLIGAEANPGYMPKAKTVEWPTPDYLFKDIVQEFGPFDLDPAATPENAKAPRFFTQEQNGLKQDWTPHKRIFINPPYGAGLGEWVAKAAAAAGAGSMVVMLLPARTDVKWFHDYVYGKPGVEVRFIKGRVRYGAGAAPAPFGSMVVIFRPTPGTTPPRIEDYQDEKPTAENPAAKDALQKAVDTPAVAEKVAEAAKEGEKASFGTKDYRKVALYDMPFINEPWTRVCDFKTICYLSDKEGKRQTYFHPWKDDIKRGVWEAPGTGFLIAYGPSLNTDRGLDDIPLLRRRNAGSDKSAVFFRKQRVWSRLFELETPGFDLPCAKCQTRMEFDPHTKWGCPKCHGTEPAYKTEPWGVWYDPATSTVIAVAKISGRPSRSK